MSWVEPLDIIEAMMKNPALKGSGRFAYEPEFLEQSEFSTIQLNHSAWWHKAQHSIGKDNMVVAVVTNCDGTATSNKAETVFLYLRLGNATAPGCFDRESTRLIGIIPDIKMEDGRWTDAEAFVRAKARLFHDSIAKIFKNFKKAGKE